MPSLPIPCTRCGRPRQSGGKAKSGVCRACRRELVNAAGWNRGQISVVVDSAEAKAERAKRWIEPERPRCDGLRSGTVTPFGVIQVRGIRNGERYYDLFDPRGVRVTLPAEQVEGVR